MHSLCCIDSAWTIFATSRLIGQTFSHRLHSEHWLLSDFKCRAGAFSNRPSLVPIIIKGAIQQP